MCELRVGRGRKKERKKTRRGQFGFLIGKSAERRNQTDAPKSSRRITTTTAIEKKTRGNRTQTPTREHINPTSAEVSFFERAILRDVCDLYTKLKAWREEREEKRLDFRAIGFKGIKKKRRKPSKDKFDNAKRVAREEDAKSPRSIQTIRNAPRKWNYYSNFKKNEKRDLSIVVRACLSKRVPSRNE